MKKISPLVSAWVGRGNFGDELLSYGLRLELYQARDIAAVTYYEKGSEAIYQAVDDVSILSLNTAGRSRWLRLYQRHLQSCAGYDCLLFGGGSVLHSSNSIAWKHELLRRFRRGRGGNTSLAAAVGVSTGPFPDSQAERQALAFLAELDVVHCRDAASLEFAQQLSGRVDVIEGRDLAFSVKALRPQLFVAERVVGRVGVSFILNPKLSEAEQGKHFCKMLAIVNYLTAAGYQVVLVSLYVGDKYADNRLHQRLRAASNHLDMIEIHNYQGDICSTIAKMASCEFYISMRLHGIIAAYLCSVPFLAMSASSKVAEFCFSVFGEGKRKNMGDLSMGVTDILLSLQESLDSSTSQLAYRSLDDGKYMQSSRELSKAFLRGM